MPWDQGSDSNKSVIIVCSAQAAAREKRVTLAGVLFLASFLGCVPAY